MAIVSVHIRTSFVVVFTCLCPVRAEVWDASLRVAGVGTMAQQGGCVDHSRVGVGTMVGVWITRVSNGGWVDGSQQGSSVYTCILQGSCRII